MTVLSAVLGHAVPALLPKRATTAAAAVLFLVFGVRMLREGLAMERGLGVGEEMREVEAELEEKEHSLARHASRRRSSGAADPSPYALESGRAAKMSSSSSRSGSPSPSASSSKTPRDRLSGLANLLSLILSPAWTQTFLMTFLG
ncbi:GCR1-dependent translation factor 1, partial [Teratosphaeriaceae sp. CCFEE 6253]